MSIKTWLTVWARKLNRSVEVVMQEALWILLSANGDTANIWKYASSMVFMPIQPYNEFSFKLEADTAFRKGDCFMLDFDSQFIYQDGIRDGIALLAVEFANDSVAQSIIHISGSQHYSLQIKDNENLGIKQVKGYFMLSDGGFATNETSESTLKLMFLEHIRLIRMHAKKEDKAKDAASKDSTKVDSHEAYSYRSCSKTDAQPAASFSKWETAASGRNEGRVG